MATYVREMAPLRLRDVVAFSHNNLWSPLPAKFRTSFRRWTLNLLYLSSIIKIFFQPQTTLVNFSHEMASMWHRNIVAFDHNKKKCAGNGRTFLFNLPFWNKIRSSSNFWTHNFIMCCSFWFVKSGHKQVTTLAVKWLPCDLGIFRCYVTIANNIVFFSYDV